MALSKTPVVCAPVKSRIPSLTYCSLKKKMRFSVPRALGNFVLRALFLLLFCGSVNSERRGLLNAAIRKKEQNSCVWQSCFTRLTGHQLVFLSECKDVVVSCVIIEPTYNHEREGRGNFVQEGKSGELASPP